MFKLKPLNLNVELVATIFLVQELLKKKKMKTRARCMVWNISRRDVGQSFHQGQNGKEERE